MGNSTKTGIWSKTSGKNLSFEQEVERAIEISADWTVGIGGRQINVTVGRLDGHWTPAWGSDEHWMYLKRPEGIWKFKCQPEMRGDWLMISQRVNDQLLPGALSIKTSQLGRGGWQWDGEEALSADMLDALLTPIPECPAEATEMWAPLCEVIEYSAEKVVVKAGEAFDAPSDAASIECSAHGNWVLVRGPASSRVAAFDMSKSKAVREGAKAGNLWLRFDGPWMRPFEVRVNAC